MKIAVFSTKDYTKKFFDAANRQQCHELQYFEPRLTLSTVAVARGFPAICIFVNDRADGEILDLLAAGGTRLIALRCAGFNNVDLDAALSCDMAIVRVPNYSPHAVAEHAIGLILTLNRNIHRAYWRVREGNMSLEGLLGFDLHGKTVGIVGTGRIGQHVATIMNGFGCEVLAYDLTEKPQVAAFAQYVPLDELFKRSRIITLHCPLTPQTHRLIDRQALDLMPDRVMLINTSRGALIDTHAVIEALKTGKIGYLGLDVYEEEADLFFEDLSSTVIQDDLFARLLTFPNVIITGHQAFFTGEALTAIADSVLASVTAFENGQPLANEVNLSRMAI